MATLLVCAYGRAVSSQEPTDRRPTVAVMYFNNSSLVDRGAYDALSRGIADILITDLTANQHIRVVERDNLQRILAEQDLTTERRVEEETAVRVGKLLGAQHMIVGGFMVDRSGTVRLDARAVHVETSRIVHVESVRGRSDDLLALIGDLSVRLQRGLKLTSSPARARPPSEAPRNVRWQSLLLYSRALLEDDSNNGPGAVTLYRKFLAETPETYAVAERQKAEVRVRELTKGTQN